MPLEKLAYDGIVVLWIVEIGKMSGGRDHGALCFG